MIRVYYLPVERINNTDRVKGSEYIHDAVLLCTENPDIRKLIMDTTSDEHDSLVAVAIEWRYATQEEIDIYNARIIILPPDPDVERAKELLANSPSAITMPEMWELMRIFGRKLRIIKGG